jgi:16S rRNA (adenine(1408)-N(1))-methyltransferase
METIRGKTIHNLDISGLHERIKYYQRVILDLGTGDGRFVRFLADQHPDWFIIGMDSCRENLRNSSRLNLKNALFVIASAQDMPQELYGLISHVTINFPWGSLLKSLLEGDTDLMHGLSSIAKQFAQIDIHSNGGALAEAGIDLQTGTQTIYDNMNRYGWILKQPSLMNWHALQNFPTTWAKRLAHGRDPRAMALSGKYTP